MKNLINLLILGLAFFLPLYLLSLSQNDLRVLRSIQVMVPTVVLIGSLLLIYLNNKNRKQAEKGKGWWLGFEILGVVGACYSVFILSVLFLFRHGVGF